MYGVEFLYKTSRATFSDAEGELHSVRRILSVVATLECAVR